MASIAAASSVANRAAGGCYAQCAYGTTCNKVTGLCEALPCGGRCLEGQSCDPVTNTCQRPKRSVPVQVMRMLTYGAWWPFGPYFDYWNPYYPGLSTQPNAPNGPNPARPPPMEPGPTQDNGLPPGL